MSDLDDAVSRAILAEAGITGDPSVAGVDQLDAESHLSLIAAGARGERVARGILHRSVAAARASGISWARIGAELGMTRQAAQQRFGDVPVPVAEDDERWLGPVTAFDEMAELEIAGREGWHTVEAAMLSHRMVRTSTQWEHRRILWRISLAADEAQGWQVGCRAFPWVYLVRDTGRPVQPSGA